MMVVKVLMGIIVFGCAGLILAALFAKGSRRKYGNVE